MIPRTASASDCSTPGVAGIAESVLKSGRLRRVVGFQPAERSRGIQNAGKDARNTAAHPTVQVALRTVAVRILPRGWWACLALIVSLFFGSISSAQDATPAPVVPIEPAVTIPDSEDREAADADGGASLSVQLGGDSGEGDVSVALQLVLVMTLLTLAPSLVILMTCFTRIVIVLGFVRTALGVPSAPANQVIIGLSLFLTVFIMGPVLDQVYEEALEPHLAEEITAREALELASGPVREFMLRQTRTNDLEFFLQLGRFPPTQVDELPMRVVIPAFITSELQTAFQMGFLLFLPFLVIDFLVSSILMSLGMMMMPPAIVSLPFKLLLFVLVDGWYLVVRGLVESFN